MSAAAPSTSPAASPRNGGLLPALPRAMTRCECAGVAFAEIARRMEAGGASLEIVMAESGVGRMCTACVPDLRSFVARFRQSPD